MFELTGFQRDLLYIAAGTDEPSGQEIRTALEEHVDNVNYGRLYPNLDTLADHGYVEKGQQDQRTNFYTLTDAGRELIEDRGDWEEKHISKMNAESA